MTMTRDEYFSQDIVARLEEAISVIAYPDGPDGEDFSNDVRRDFLVWKDDGIGIHVCDVIHDAIVIIKRLRAGLPENWRDGGVLTEDLIERA